MASDAVDPASRNRRKESNTWIPALRFAAAGMTSRKATIITFSSPKGEGFQPSPSGTLNMQTRHAGLAFGVSEYNVFHVKTLSLEFEKSLLSCF